MFHKIFIIFFGLVLFGNFISSNCHAQDADLKWAIKPSYSILQYSGELGSQFFSFDERNDGGGLFFSHYLSPSFDFVFGMDYNRLNFQGSNEFSDYMAEGNLFLPSFSFNYKFNNNHILPVNSAIKPYIGLGFAYMTGNTKGTSYDLEGDNFTHFVDEVSFNWVAGVKYELTHRVSAFVEIHQLMTTSEELDGAAIDRNNDKFGGARLGLFIKISRVKDQDKDGVPDKDDECPDTPPGVKVDENGCPLDRDNDGIPDYKDDCPDEPGLPEYNGCPDSDGDGIIDKEDDCPDLPGLPEYNGCPDSDGDGVIDPKDLCPDTQPGVMVDEYGCPIDSDGDGLSDDVDHCPDVYGPPEYLGCPEPPDVGWPSMNKDTPPEVYFQTAEYELDPEAEEELQKIVKYMFENPMMNIRLYGFADPRGTKDYNAVLSARRVEAVKKFLMRKGLPENRIMVKALGEIQEVKTRAGEEKMSIDQKYRKARKVQFETFFFMH